MRENSAKCFYLAHPRVRPGYGPARDHIDPDFAVPFLVP